MENRFKIGDTFCIWNDYRELQPTEYVVKAIQTEDYGDHIEMWLVYDTERYSCRVKLEKALTLSEWIEKALQRELEYKELSIKDALETIEKDYNYRINAIKKNSELK